MKKHLLFFLVFCFLTAGIDAQSYPVGSPVDCHGQLQVENFQLKDKNGKTVQLKGLSSHSLQWYGKFMTYGAIGTMVSEWNANIIRASMYVEKSDMGYLSNPGIKTVVQDIVNIAGQLGIYVIIDWHLTADPVLYKDYAKGFFEEMASLYKDQPHVIYEICNQPKSIAWDNGTDSDLKSYSEYLITAIRAIDTDNLILVGTPSLSQDIDVVALNPLTSQTNILYSFHFNAASHFFYEKLQSASDKIPVFVSEWGTNSSDGTPGIDTTNSNTWLDLLAGNNTGGNNPGQQVVSWCNWSLCDKPEYTSVLKPGSSPNGGWSDNDLTESGLYIKNKLINSGYTNPCDLPGPFLLTLLNTTGGSVVASPLPDSAGKYSKNKKVTLTATSGTGYSFAGWIGNASGKTNPLNIIMNKDKTIKAVFANDSNLIKNGDFSNGSTYWTQQIISPGSGNIDYSSGAAKINISAVGSSDWQIALMQGPFTLKNSKLYVLSFDAWASSPRFINPNIGQSEGSYIGYSKFPLIELTTDKKTYELTFVMPDPDYTKARLEFNTGQYSSATVYIDNVMLREAGDDPNPEGPFSLLITKTEGGMVTVNPSKTTYNKGDSVTITGVAYEGYAFDRWRGIVDNTTNPLVIAILSNTNVNAIFSDKSNLIKNPSFNSSTDWQASKSGCVSDFTSSVTEGQYAFTIVDPGPEEKCVKLYQSGLNIEKSKSYQIQFDAFANMERDIRVHIANNMNPDNEYTHLGLTHLTTEKNVFYYTFSMDSATDGNARIEFLLGKYGTGQQKIYIDNVKVRVITIPSQIQKNNTMSADVFQIIPNPVVSGVFRIHVPDDMKEACLTIFDLSGRKIISDHIQSVDTGFLTGVFTGKGIYLLNLKNSKYNVNAKIIFE